VPVSAKGGRHARLRHGDVGDRFRGHAGNPHEAAVVVDEHEHVETAEENRVDMEEVTGNQPFRLGSEEL